jgi:hypothetical protein
VETYGRLEKPVVAFLGVMGAEGVAAGTGSKSSFVAAALWELSIILREGNYLMHWVSVGEVA